MTDFIGRIAALEGELEAARARIGELEAIRAAAYRYMFCGSGRDASGDELIKRLLGEVR